MVPVVDLSTDSAEESFFCGQCNAGARDKKMYRYFEYFQRPVSKMPSQALEISLSLFYFFQAPIEKLLVRERLAFRSETRTRRVTDKPKIYGRVLQEAGW